MRKKRTIVELLDDFDGTSSATTVDFSFEGVQYEIELSDEHLEEMREYLAPYIEHARRVGSQRRPPAPKQRVAAKKLNTKAVRAWAVEQGIEVSRTGRIPTSVVEQYETAH